MLSNTDQLGGDWIQERINSLTYDMTYQSPVEFNEENRYLPQGVTSSPGYIRFSKFPYWREPLNCADVRSTVRSVSILKGVQVGYTTLLESILLYYMGYVKTLPCMFMTADKELAKVRIQNNIIPMLQQSEMMDMLQSADTGNARKSGNTVDLLQWVGGGSLVPFGAVNANKMRSFSIALMLKDEIDGWPVTVGSAAAGGKDGDPDGLSDDRCNGYPDQKKIYRGSTPKILELSKITKAYNEGDQRQYFVPCKHCGELQVIRWSRVDERTGRTTGMVWETDGNRLVKDSVRYLCKFCDGEHFEYDKTRMFATESGAIWKPTNLNAVDPSARSYHLPAMYSPVGFKPWWEQVTEYLNAYDPEHRTVKNMGNYQKFYNNVLGQAFKTGGQKIKYQSVDSKRLGVYRYGEIPNGYAMEHSGGPIVALTCQVDVHKANLAVAVMGWTRNKRCYLIEYKRIEDEDCRLANSPAWDEVRELIHNTWTADNGSEYPIALTLIDAGDGNAEKTVMDFCTSMGNGVYALKGRQKTSRASSLSEFEIAKNLSGQEYVRIATDYYKDFLGPMLRYEWIEGTTLQPDSHFNAPINATKKQLTELTVEERSKKVDDRGNIFMFWKRPEGVNNELWDLLVYGHAAIDILAYDLYVNQWEKDDVDWPEFWNYLEDEHEYFTVK